MSTMIQASPRDAAGTLYNIKSEGDEPEVVWADFGAILTQIGGVETARKVRDTLASVLNGAPATPAPAPTVMQQAVATAQNAFPGAQVVSQQPAEETWGNPPVQPMQQPAQQYQQPAPEQAPMPAAAAPFCQHGQKTFLSKLGKNGKPWKAWACPGDRNDPTKCELDFIRG